MQNNIRSRNWCIITYEYPDICLEYLLKSCRYYAYIRHDLDLKDDGVTFKEPHYHVIVCLRNARTFSSMSKCSQGLQNIFVEPCNNLASSFAYLTHKNDPDKFPYRPELIESNNLSWFYSLTPDFNESDISLTIIDDIISKKPVRELVRLYGRDFIIHYKQYFAIASLVSEEDSREFYKSNKSAAMEDFEQLFIDFSSDVSSPF